MFGLRCIGGTAAILGFAALTLGMMSRLPAGFFKVATQVAFVCSVFGTIQVIIAEHFHDIDIELVYQIGLLLSAIIFVWVIILGVAMY